MVSDAMKQLEERHLANKVELVIWSNKMDLLALSNSKGEVCLHRLNWQRAWILVAPSEDVKVAAMAWRPDGKVIAVAYSSGLVVLVKVENKEVLHRVQHSAEEGISLMAWVEDRHSNLTTDAKYFQECASVYLAKLPPQSSSLGSMSEHQEGGEEVENLKLVSEQTSLNLLLVASGTGCLSMWVFGVVPCGTLQLPPEARGGRVTSMDTSPDLKHLYVSVDCGDAGLKLVLYDTSVLDLHTRELFNVAYKYCMLVGLVDYLKSIMDNVGELYENMLLLEMEAKWSEYSEECSLSSDFLELLVFGIASVELDKFLVKDLTEKGIQKLGNSIEMSHWNIQKLMRTHLVAVCTDIVFHLSDFRAMTRLTDRYRVLGVDERIVTRTFKEVGAFVLKADELRLVIDSSLAKYKAFFKWITGVFPRLISENPNHPVTELSREEIDCIAEYLYGLDARASGGKARERHWLDKVGEYLLDKELGETVPECKPNEWLKFIMSNNKFLKNDIVIVRDEKLSLVQQMNKLMGVMGEMMEGIKDAVGKKADPLWTGDIGPAGFTGLTTVSTAPDTLTLALNKDGKLHVIKVVPGDEAAPQVTGVRTRFTDGPLSLRLIDLQFYVENTLSLLLEECDEGRGALFLQLPLGCVERSGGTLDTSRDLKTGGRRIDNMVGGKLAVSGARKVAVVVSENGHKVRTYETEVEEDDEPDMDLISSNNTSLDHSQ